MFTSGAVCQMNSSRATWAEEAVVSDCGESTVAADF